MSGQIANSALKPNQLGDHKSIPVELPKAKKAKLELLFNMLDTFTKSTSDAFQTAQLSSTSSNPDIMATVSPHLTGDFLEHWVKMAALDDAILAKYEPKDHRDALERLNSMPSAAGNMGQSKEKKSASDTQQPGKQVNSHISGKNIRLAPPVRLRRSERTIKPADNSIPKIITAPPPKPTPELAEPTTSSRPRPSLKRSFDTKLTINDREEIKMKRARSTEFNKPTETNLSELQANTPIVAVSGFTGNEGMKLEECKGPATQKKTVKTRSIESRAQHKVLQALKIAECILFQAASFIIRCDGTFQESIKATLPEYDAEHVSKSARAAGESIETWCDKNNLGLFDDSKLVELPNVPFTLVDCKGKVLLVNLPGFYSERDREIFTEELLDVRSRLHARVDQSDINGRGDPESYVQDESRVSGDVLGGGVQRFTDIQNHFHFIRFFTTLLNYALFRCFPESYNAHAMMRASLKQKFPAVKAVSANNPNMLSGTSYIYNRWTNLHTDHREGEKGISPLAVMGDCKTGYLGVPRVRVKVKYLPRNLVFIHGRLLDHKVMEWKGKDDGNRICLAHFNHEDEWRNSGVLSVW